MGNESPPTSPASATTSVKALDTIRLEAEDGQRRDTSQAEPLIFPGDDKSCSGGKFVGVKVPGDEKTPLAARIKAAGATGSIAWKVQVKTAGDYKVWLRLRSRDRQASPKFALDGRNLPAPPSVKFGYYDPSVANSIWGQIEKAYRWFWTDLPMYRQLDPRPLRIALTPGEHELTLSNLGPGLDYTWIPEGDLNYF
jgi:hypothetical protein